MFLIVNLYDLFFPAPVIINAVVLLTNTFDLNIIYRHDSTASKAKDPNVLDTSWALVNITIPAILGKHKWRHNTFLQDSSFTDSLKLCSTFINTYNA